jgi:hypothetical protein
MRRWWTLVRYASGWTYLDEISVSVSFTMLVCYIVETNTAFPCPGSKSLKREPSCVCVCVCFFLRCVKSWGCGLVTRPVPACSDSVDAPYICCLNVEAKPNSQGPTKETANYLQSDVYYQNADLWSYSFTGCFGTGGKGYCAVMFNKGIY